MVESELRCGIPNSTSIAGRSVVLTGCGRSGTSILGRLVASLEGFEYEYEPPLLVALLAAAPKVTEEIFRLFWETFVVEHVLLGSLAGRSLNTNPYDESSAFGYLADEEVASRLSRSHGTASLMGKLASTRVVIKMPDVPGSLAHLTSVYPSVSVLASGRSPGPVIASVLNKGWFRTDGSFTNSLPIRRSGSHEFPFWLAKEFETAYISGRQVDRAAIYYICMHRAVVELKSAVLIDYEILVRTPLMVLESLEFKLSARRTPQTEAVLSSIEHRSSSADLALDELDSGLRSETLDTWRLWQERSRALWC